MIFNYDEYNNVINAVNVADLILGYVNLLENRAQSRHNDVQGVADIQTEILLRELKKEFEIQNRILEEQNKRLDRIIEILEGR